MAASMLRLTRGSSLGRLSAPQPTRSIRRCAVLAPPRAEAAAKAAAAPKKEKEAAEGRFGKTALKDAVEKEAKLTKAQASAAVDAVLKTITDTLVKGEEVSLTGFGTFKVGSRAARKGRNPSTGAPLDIAAANYPKFTAGKGLKDAVKDANLPITAPAKED